MTTTIIWTIAIITLLGVLLAVVLYLVAEKFKVEEDPRIDEVEKVMPGSGEGDAGSELRRLRICRLPRVCAILRRSHEPGQ